MATVDDLVQEVRDLTSEQNLAAPTNAAIVRMLSRGQRFVASQLVLHYVEPLVVEFTPTDLQVTAGIVPIPKDAFEDRVLYCEFIMDGSRPYRVPWRRFDQVASLRFSSATVPVPYAIYTVGRELRFAGTPSGAYSCSISYVQSPPNLVLSQGRVTAVGATYLMVDQAGASVSSENDNLLSYINVIDHQTGKIKASFQVGALPEAGNRINIRSTPQRSTVQGRAVSGSASLAASEILPDDYVCQITGSCVPMLNGAFDTYLVGYAAAEVSRSLDEATTQLSGQIAEALRHVAQQQDAGRGTPTRVKNTSKIWSRLSPFRFLPGSK